MAVAAADDEKPRRLGCLTAARWVVASAVAVAILVVMVYAIVVVLRPGDLTLTLVGGQVFVRTSSMTPNAIFLNFTMRAVNPSGRVRIYYTGIRGRFRGSFNRSSEADVFLVFKFEDITVDQQSYVDTISTAKGIPNSSMPQDYYDWLYKGHTISDAMLTLNGTRIFENSFLGENKTSEPGTIYYCTSIIVGGDDNAAADAVCGEHLPASATSP